MGAAAIAFCPTHLCRATITHRVASSQRSAIHLVPRAYYATPSCESGTLGLRLCGLFAGLLFLSPKMQEQEINCTRQTTTSGPAAS
eukprot:6190627-Pleurochrysis_carterae.AAC.6